MNPHKFHLLFLAQIVKKLLTREVYIWRTKAKLMTQNRLAIKREIVLKQDLLMRNSLNSTSQGRFTPIIESRNERTPSPLLNIFEELKSNLNKKVHKVDPLLRPQPKVVKLQSTTKKTMQTTRSTPTINKICSISARTSALHLDKGNVSSSFRNHLKK